jgi:hypothetical protein
MRGEVGRASRLDLRVGDSKRERRKKVRTKTTMDDEQERLEIQACIAIENDGETLLSLYNDLYQLITRPHKKHWPRTFKRYDSVADKQTMSIMSLDWTRDALTQLALAEVGLIWKGAVYPITTVFLWCDKNCYCVTSD